MKLNEIRILSGIHPTVNQKRVIAIILASPSPKVANEEITGDENMLAARNILMKLGVVAVSATGAVLTDKGTQIAQDELIADASGQLTDTGNKLVHGDTAAEEPQPNPTEPLSPVAEPQLGLESFSLLRKMLAS